MKSWERTEVFKMEMIGGEVMNHYIFLIGQKEQMEVGGGRIK